MRRAIYEDDVIKLLDKGWKSGVYPVASNIYALPSAQPERKTGRWLTSDDMYETGVCSVCKCDSQEPVSYTIRMFKYCPNCGADMRGAERREG